MLLIATNKLIAVFIPVFTAILVTLTSIFIKPKHTKDDQ